MILVDTSVWVDHLRGGDDMLAQLLEGGMVLAHPFVTGEILLGNLPRREAFMEAMLELPQAAVAEDQEVMLLINQRKLFGRGIGYVDTHLLASVRLTAGARLWTRDKRLHAIAGEFLLGGSMFN